MPSVPARRRPSGGDVALAAGLLVLGLLEATWVLAGERPFGLILVLPLAIPLAWRKLNPSRVVIIVSTAFVVQLPSSSLRLFDQTFTGFVCVLLASYALGRHGRGPWAVPVLAGCAFAMAVTLGWYDRSVGTFVLALVLVLAPAATGRVVANRSALRELLDRQADMLRENAEVVERTRVAEVRGRIAGEVQDLVSRRVQQMVERSEAARRLAERDGSGAAALVAAVEVDGRAALGEMRTMLGVLRSTGLSDSFGRASDPPSGASRARRMPPRRVELLLIAAFVVLALAESLAAFPDALPIVSLTMLGPLLTFAVGARTRGRTALAGLALALVAITAINLLAGMSRWEDYAFPLVLVALAWLGGRLVREQHDLVERSTCRAIALERSAQIRAEAAATEERLRLARELHDVLGHTLMVMVVQAGAARRILESGRGDATEPLNVIAATGDEASTELRRLLTLVDPEGEPGAADPDGTPGLPDLRSLADRARAAGLTADLVVEGEPVPMSSGLALAVYRVAQEAVTNVIRHAEAQHVRLGLRYALGQVQIEVRDDGRAICEAPGTSSGNGIIGMRERVGTYGGKLFAGPSPGRGFVVMATFPLIELVQEQPA